MSSGGRDRTSRAERERARVYQARLTLHEGQVRRRRRDNVLAAVIGGILILAVAGAQVAFYTAGPGAPEPTPSTSASPDPTAAEDSGLVPDPTSAPDPGSSEQASAVPTP